MQGIYAIVNTANGRRYVGSSLDINRRWRQHVHDLDRGLHVNAHLQRAWKRYGSAAFTFVVVEEVFEPDAVIVREQHHIDLNVGGYNIGAAGRAMLGRTHSAATRDKLRARALLRAPLAQEVRDRIAAALRGRTASPATRAKLSAQRKGRPHGPVAQATKDKIRVAHLGSKQSAETVAKRAAALKGIPRSAEWRAKTSASLMGHGVSEESREKMRAARTSNPQPRGTNGGFVSRDSVIH